MNYVLHLLTTFNVYFLVALSLNLVVGYCGLLTLAHASFFALGGYAYALLAIRAGWGFLPAALGASLLAAVASLTVSLPARRLRGDFFVLASLAVQALFFGLLNNWTALTNGASGIPGIPRPRVFSLVASTPMQLAVLTAGVAAVAALALWRLGRSPWARALLSMREDELAARSLGKDTRMLKAEAIAWSAAIAALAGAMYASHLRFLDPSVGSLDEGILMLSMVLVGGVGNFLGPFVGAAVLVLLPEALRFVAVNHFEAGSLRLLVYGLTLVLLMHLRPQGLAGAYRLNRQ